MSANRPAIELPADAKMADYQRYIKELEAQQGWQDVDLVHNCFLMGEEVGELFKAIRKQIKLFPEAQKPEDPPEAVAEELVDVFNYLLAIANRLEIDLEAAFRSKNAHNQTRTWQS